MCIRRKPRSGSGSRACMHDFVRDSVRAALMKARPVPQFVTEMRAHATAGQALTSGSLTPGAITPGAMTPELSPGAPPWRFGDRSGF
jgi:hypothetical protein